MGEAIPVVVNNLTPTFWSVCVLIVVVLAAAIKVWPSLDRQKREGDASLRADLMQMLAEEKRGHAEEMAALRKEMSDERHECDRRLRAGDEKMRELHNQVEVLQRMILQFSSSSGQAIDLGKVPEAVKSITRVEEHRANRGEK